jgi:hypothetical protein
MQIANTSGQTWGYPYLLSKIGSVTELIEAKKLQRITVRSFPNLAF